MNEWLKKLFDQARSIWSKWSIVQRLIFIGVGVAAVTGLVLLIVFSSSPSSQPILTQPITDEALRQRIGARLDTEGIDYTVTAEGVMMVADRATALRARAIISTEGLLPDTDPWALFDMDRWTITDYERDVNLRRSITNQLIQHIEALEDVDNASVTIVMPEKSLFAEDQDPVTASVIITPKPGSDITENRNKLEGIQELVQFSIPGLTAEFITITDLTGRKLNDFDGMEDLDRLAINQRELRLKRDLENQYIRAIKTAPRRDIHPGAHRDPEYRSRPGLRQQGSAEGRIFPHRRHSRQPGDSVLRTGDGPQRASFGQAVRGKLRGQRIQSRRSLGRRRADAAELPGPGRPGRQLRPNGKPAEFRDQPPAHHRTGIAQHLPDIHRGRHRRRLEVDL
jgi:hypothetical protein